MKRIARCWTTVAALGVGFITDGVSFPLPPSLGRSTTVMESGYSNTAEAVIPNP